MLARISIEYLTDPNGLLYRKYYLIVVPVSHAATEDVVCDEQ